jgi:hypothetical protein
MPNALRPAAALFAVLLCNAANASLVTIDPGSFASGTDISNAFTGASLATLTIPNYPDDYVWPDDGPLLEKSAVFAAECTNCAASTIGQTVFSPGQDPWGPGLATTFDYSEKVARQMQMQSGPQMPGSKALLVNFDEATNYVEVIGGGANNGNFFRLDIWNLAGELLGTCSSAAANNTAGCTSTVLGNSPNDPETRDQWSLSFQTDLLDIAYITTGGWSGGQYVRSVGFESGAPVEVPEPASLGLMALGLSTIVMGRRKKARKAA